MKGLWTLALAFGLINPTHTVFAAECGTGAVAACNTSVPAEARARQLLLTGLTALERKDFARALAAATEADSLAQTMPMKPFAARHGMLTNASLVAALATSQMDDPQAKDAHIGALLIHAGLNTDLVGIARQLATTGGQTPLVRRADAQLDFVSPSASNLMSRMVEQMLTGHFENAARYGE